MDLKEKESFLKKISEFDSRYYPHVSIWNENISESRLKKEWRARVKEILKGDKDFPGLYLHIPYCQTKCYFCQFLTRATNSTAEVNRYLKLLEKEINFFSPLFKDISFSTLYLAGGTPTILSASQLDFLFNLLEKKFDLENTFQRIIESTPSTLDEEKIKVIKKYRFNRLTIGIQTADRKLLKKVNRPFQTKNMIKKIFKIARKEKIEILNVDLILGMPFQSSKSFFESLEFVISLMPEAIHIFPYKDERETLFKRWGIVLKDKDIITRKRDYEIAEKLLKKAGYKNFKHEPFLLTPKAANFQLQFCYELSSLLGLGANALSYIPYHLAYTNPSLDDYEKMGKGVMVRKGYFIDKEETIRYYVLEHIRGGIKINDFEKRFGVNFRSFFSEEIKELRKVNRLEIKNGVIRIKAKGDYEAKDDSDFRTYSRFFYSQKVIDELKKTNF